MRRALCCGVRAIEQAASRERIDGPADRVERQARPLGDIENAVRAIGEIEDPQKSKLIVLCRLAAERRHQSSSPELRLSHRAQIHEAEIVLHKVDDFEQRGE